MAYPKIKTKDVDICLTPELLKEVGRQVPAQLKCMSFTEMIALWRAGQEAVNAIKNAPGVANILALFR